MLKSSGPEEDQKKIKEGPCESIPWRSRVIIQTAADIAAGDYPIREALVRIYPTQAVQLPAKLRLADILLPSSEGLAIYDAVMRSHELVQELLDRISVVSYGKTSLTKWFSTCPLSANVGERFQVATLDCHSFVSPAAVCPADLSGFDDKSDRPDLMHIAHLTRLALSAKRSDEQFRHLVAILERIADLECNEFIPGKCPICKESFLTSRKATSNYIRSRLLELGVSNSKASGYIRLRGRIAHGGGPFDQKFAHAVTTACGELMGHVLSLVADRLGVTILRVENMIAYLPIALYTFDLISLTEPRYVGVEVKGTVAWPKVTKNAIGLVGGYSQFGVEFDPGMKPRIDPIAWPNVEIAIPSD